MTTFDDVLKVMSSGLQRWAFFISRINVIVRLDLTLSARHIFFAFLFL